MAEPRASAAPGAQTGGGAIAHAATPCGVDSETLMGGRHLLLIRHAGETYTLRLTRQNKLLLTK